MDYGEQIGGRQVLGGQNAVHRLEGELTPAVQEIGEMRLAKAGLASQQGDAERSPLYPAQQLQAETFVHLGKIHLWKIRHQQWEGRLFVFLQEKSIRADWPSFSSASASDWKALNGKLCGTIDARDTYL